MVKVLKKLDCIPNRVDCSNIILPTVYDEALSYYENIRKLNAYVNRNICKLTEMYNTIYEIVSNGFGSGVTITYNMETEDLEFIVSEDIGTTEDPDIEELTKTVNELEKKTTVIGKSTIANTNNINKINDKIDDSLPINYDKSKLIFGEDL